MKILDKLVSKIAIIFLAFMAIVFIFLPFDIIRIISLSNITNFLKNIEGNYIYSLGAVVVLMLSIKSLFSGITGGTSRENNIVTHMNFGDLKISDQAIEGLTKNVISKIVGIRSEKVIVDFIEGYISLHIKGEVSPEINIPQVTAEIQTQVKDSIEGHTGIPVNQVNISILSISSPMKSIK